MIVFLKKYFWFLTFIWLLVIYSPVINAPLFWDDDDNITKNVYVKNLDLKSIFTQNQIAGASGLSNQYRPFLSTTFAIEYLFVKDWPFLYHLVNIFIHFFNGVLLFKILKKLLKKDLLTYFLTFLFLIHPVHTEAVSYIAGRTDLLGLMFILLPFYLILKNERKKFTLVNIITFFTLGLLSKETDIIFPAVLFTVIFFFQKYFFEKKSLFLFPVFILSSAISLIYIILRLTIFNFQNTLNFYQNQNIFTQSILVRIITFLAVLPTYIQLFFAPVKLYAERSSTIYASFLQPMPVIGSFILLIFVCFIFFGIRKKNPLLSFGALWFLIALFPVSNILVPVNAIVTEHWLYIPSIGIILMLGGLLQLTNKKWITYSLSLFFIIYTLFFTYQTYTRNIDWSDPIVFYEKTLKDAPYSGRVANNLAMLYANNHILDKAVYYYKKGIAISDTYPQPHYNLGNLYIEKKDYKKAEEEYLRAIEIDPSFFYAYDGLYNLYIFEKKLDKAEEIKKKFNEKFVK